MTLSRSRLSVLGVANALGAYCKGGVALRKRRRAHNLAGSVLAAPCKPGKARPMHAGQQLQAGDQVSQTFSRHTTDITKQLLR